MFKSLFKYSPEDALIHDVKTMATEYPFTKDMAKLEQYYAVRLFVYGEEMYQRKYHELIQEYAIPLCSAFTEPKYFVWKKRLGAETYPIALAYTPRFSEPTWSGRHMPEAAIKGELYAIRPYRIIELDKHRCNGVQFIRVRQPIYIPHREVIWTKQQGIITTAEATKKVWAWIYLGVPDYWLDQLDGGYLFEPVRAYKPNNGWAPPYYYFSTKETLDK